MNVNGNNPVQRRPPTRSRAGRDYQETIDLTGGTDDDESVESFSPHHLAAGDDAHRLNGASDSEFEFDSDDEDITYGDVGMLVGFIGMTGVIGADGLPIDQKLAKKRKHIKPLAGVYLRVAVVAPVAKTAHEIRVAAANNGFLPLHEVFADITNDETGRGLRYELNELCKGVLEVMGIKILRWIRKSNVITGNFAGYIQSTRDGTVALLLIKFCFGHDISLYSYRSINYIAVKYATDPEVMEQYNNVLLPMLRYVFLWVIPANSDIKYMNVIKHDVYSWQNRMRSGPRTKLPVWSNEYMELNHKEVSPMDSAICSGHLLDYVLLLDAHVPGMYNRCLGIENHPSPDNPNEVRAFIDDTERPLVKLDVLEKERYWNEGIAIDSDNDNSDD